MRSAKHVGGAQYSPVSRNGKALSPVLYLYDELILVEILSCLPVKSLVRFKCVSKSWKSFISDPYFVKLHLQRSATNSDFAHHQFTSVHLQSCSVHSLFGNSSSSSTNSQDLGYGLRAYEVVGSCNGLLCLASFKEYCVHLFNPATRLISQKSPSLYVDWPFTMFGFGYDHLSDTYKVVAILFKRSHEEEPQKTVVKVYGMGDNSWRNIEIFPAVPIYDRNNGLYLNGTLNWVAIRNFSSFFNWNPFVTIDQLVIVSLDLGKEKCRKLLLPQGLDYVPYIEANIGVLRDCLCVSHDYEKTHFVVWQMKEFGVEKSWTQLVKLCYDVLQTDYLGHRLTLSPLCISKNGDVLLLSYPTHEAILYNLKDSRLKKSKIPNGMNWIDAKVYVESLVLPC